MGVVLLAHEIAEERSVESLDRKVLAPDGSFVRVTHVYRTVPMPVWRLTTSSYSIECAAQHLVVTTLGTLPVRRVKADLGILVLTRTGWEPVLELIDLQEMREMFDLRVESEDHLYFTGGIASHNSTGLVSSELLKFDIIPRYKVIYLTPLKEQSKTIADMMVNMQRGSVYPPDYFTSRGFRNNLYYKESPRGGFIKLMHILTDPSKIRGNSCGNIVVDECCATGSLLTTYDSVGKYVDLPIEKFTKGMQIAAHDESGFVVTDRVVNVINKGARPVWQICLSDGKQLTCTSNEKLKTTRGWVYLSQLLTPSEISRCDRAQQIQRSVSGSRGHVTGEHAGGRVGGVDVSQPEVQDDAWLQAGTLLQPQGKFIIGLREDAAEVDKERRVRGVELPVSYRDLASVSLLVLSDAPRGAREAQPTESRHQSMGGSADVESAGLLVHGRRDAASESSPLHDSLVLARGMPDLGGQASADGAPWSDRQADEEEQQDVSHRGATDGGREGLPAEHLRIRASVDALQVGSSGELPRVLLLPRRVRDGNSGEGSAHGYTNLLREGDVPAADGQGPRGSRDREETGTRADDQPEVERAEGRDTDGVSPAERQGRKGEEIFEAGWLRQVQRHATRVEEEAEGRRDQRAREPEAHLPVLRGGVLEHRNPQDGQAESRDLLRDTIVPQAGIGDLRGNSESQSAGEMGEGQIYGDLVPVSVVSITYAGVQEVWDVETELHHTLFAGGIAVHNCQDFDPEHLPEIEQVQKAFQDTRSTVFAGTSKDLDTCLEAQYRIGSRAVWHIPCGCPKRFHSLDPEDRDTIKAMISIDGLACPDVKGKLLDPMLGEFVHADRSKLLLNMPSFHLPQVIVPAYAYGRGFADIYRDFKRYPFKKFLQEVWGLAVDTGMTEISEGDLKKCCTTKTFEQTQQDYLKGKVVYVRVISGVDWGGSDWEPAYRSKLSYTVHTIYGMRGDGSMDLIYAMDYSGMNYRDIAGSIVAAHNKFKAFAMGTDNGGGAYYNAYMRDCGRIPTNLIIHFQYTDTKLMLERIQHPEAHIMSLHRSDSISALIADIKDQKISWPRWDESSRLVMHCLHVRRNITEAPSGKTILRYIKHGARADDFFMSTNYAVMMKRIINREPLIPNQQVIDQLRNMFGLAIPNDMAARMGGFIEGGTVSG